MPNPPEGAEVMLGSRRGQFVSVCPECGHENPDDGMWGAFFCRACHMGPFPTRTRWGVVLLLALVVVAIVGAAGVVAYVLLS